MNGPCGVTACDRQASQKPSRRGYCEMHYLRWKRYGDANHLTNRMRVAVEVEQFWATIRQDGATRLDECLEWPAARNAKGYGVTKKNGSRIVPRVVWTQVFGPIPPGLLVCHTCDNPPCGRPSHLFLGTSADNSSDMVRKGRSSIRYGAANARTRLTDDQIREIRRRRSGGEVLRTIAEDFGISNGGASRIALGRRRDRVS